MNNAEPIDRRGSFRIDDTVSLQVQPIENNFLEQRLEKFWQHRDAFSLLNAFTVHDDHLLPKRTVVEKQYPQIASYLSALEDKIQALARIMMMRDAEMPSEPTHNVNLSATGVRYFAAKPVQKEDYLEVRMQLHPSLVRLMAIGKVVWVVNMQDAQPSSKTVSLHEAYAIGVDFEHMHDEDRELLYKHIHLQQMQSLRQKN